MFPAQRVVHAGDVLPFKAVPLLDVSNGASGLEYPRTIERAVAALEEDVDTVISGHYPRPLTMADLAEYGRFTREFVDAVLAAIALEHGAAVYTTDRDFSRFSGLKWTNPLVANG